MTIRPSSALEVIDTVAESVELEKLGVGWPDSTIFGLLDVLVCSMPKDMRSERISLLMSYRLPPQPYDFILLQPREFVGTRMGGAAKEFLNEPGVYEFVVEYTSYLSED